MSDKIVFISHSTKDDQIVNGIRQALEHLLIEAWADSQRLVAGDQLTPKIEGAIQRASHLIAILSVNAINSAWVSKEIKFALGLKKKVIAVMLPGIEPAALPLWFGEEPVGLKIAMGLGGVSAALPDLLAGLGERLPDERVEALQAQVAPIADLVLTLLDPAITGERATASATLTYCPPDGGRQIESRRFRFTAPIGAMEAGELSWYLERYSYWPISQERAREVVETLPKWGRMLYETLNVEQARAALEAWKAAPENVERRFTVKVDKELEDGAVANEPATVLLSLPWELIHDERGFLFQGARGVRVRRSLPNRHPQRAIVTDPPIRVLLVSPRPEDDSAAYIDHRASARPLVEALSKLGDLAEFTLLTPPTFKALQEELQRKTYHVVHFDGHGLEGALCFEDPSDSKNIEGRRMQLVKADQLAEVLRDHRVPLFFLDACQSASVAGALLESGVASVAAMSHAVLVETARRFAEAFYPELMAGKRVGQAMLTGQRALKIDGFRAKLFTGDLRLEDWFVPVLFQEAQDPQLIREVPAQRVQEIIADQKGLVLGNLPQQPDHGFVGRGRELLKAERILVIERYVVFQGGGGEGKTTLGVELARWLAFTRRIERGAFVRLDEDGDARKVLFAIGGQLVPNYHSRAAVDEAVARQLVERALREKATVIVLDNMESVLAPAPGSEAGLAFDPETLAGILELCWGLGKIGETRLILTSREALPAPFAGNVQRIGRLNRADAIRLVERVLGEGKRMPHTLDEAASEEEIGNLVDAVGCHARAVTLLAGEVAASGVGRATEKIYELMASLEKQHPGERERSLLASVELSLRRLAAETRKKMRPLGVFQGGGSLPAIELALGLDAELCLAFARELVEVGLAEQLGFGYLLFDPALAPALLAEMTDQERENARVGWATAIASTVDFFYEQLVKDANLALHLALLELPNILAVLEYLRDIAAPEQVAGLAGRVEQLVGALGRPKALARVMEIRVEAAQKLSAWGRARFGAEMAAANRLIEQGRHHEAVQAAEALLKKAQAAGESAYYGAAYDLAMAHLKLGQALQMSGAAAQAIAHLDEARFRFQALGKIRSVNLAVVEKADCFVHLGRYEEAAEAYEEAIQEAEELRDMMQAALNRGQLATVRMLQKRYSEALDLHGKVLDIFKQLGAPGSVAASWHQIGRVHEEAEQYEAAERAYQESLKIKVQIGNGTGEAMTLGQLGNLYSRMGRREDAVLFYRKAANVFAQVNDLKNEGSSRTNIADELVKLKRYDETRVELLRAIACLTPFGHAAQQWRAFNVLSNLERATGNEPKARKAQERAMQAYLAYRCAGGESRTLSGQLCTLLAQEPDAAKRQLATLREMPKLTISAKSLLVALEAVLAGSRDPALADDPNLDYDDAAELLLLIEKLG